MLKTCRQIRRAIDPTDPDPHDPQAEAAERSLREQLTTRGGAVEIPSAIAGEIAVEAAYEAWERLGRILDHAEFHEPMMSTVAELVEAAQDDIRLLREINAAYPAAFVLGRV
jgi:hypothetical protein